VLIILDSTASKGSPSFLDSFTAKSASSSTLSQVTMQVVFTTLRADISAMYTLLLPAKGRKRRSTPLILVSNWFFRLLNSIPNFLCMSWKHRMAG
jgi:hypothetical protein